MSWDLLIYDFPANAKRVEDIPKDFKPGPLGTREEMIEKIQQVLPTSDFESPEWGLFEADDFCIEFHLGDDPICQGISLSVRGGGDATEIISQLLTHLSLRAIDVQTSEFFSAAAAAKSFSKWQAFRDKVISLYSADDNGPKKDSP